MRERELSEVMVTEEKHQTEEDGTQQNFRNKRGHNFIMDWKCAMQEKTQSDSQMSTGWITVPFSETEQTRGRAGKHSSKQKSMGSVPNDTA